MARCFGIFVGCLTLHALVCSLLSPEKVYGVPLIVFYHVFAWLGACFVALDFDGSRFTTEVCRSARIVMMPCLLRRETIDSSLPWFHVLGFGVILAAIAIILHRYNSAKHLLRESLANAVRKHLRRQLLYAGTVTLVCVLVLIDSTRTCREDTMTYITATCFAGLGLFLGAHRLIGSLIQASQGHRNNSRTGPSESQTSLITECSPPTTSLALQDSFGLVNASPSCNGAAGYRLVDISTLLDRLRENLQEEELQRAQQRELLKREMLPEAAAAIQLAMNRASSKLDDDQETQVDLVRSTGPCSSGADTSFTVVAPRSFVYLRQLAGVDGEGLLSQLMRADAGELRSAAKSGSSLLCSSDQRTFVLKTVSRSEVRLLRLILPAYRRHLEEHPDALLCRVYGCYSFRNAFGYDLDTVLMDCLSGLPLAALRGTSLEDTAPVHSFDVKSEFQDSGFCRYFPEGLRLEPSVRGKLLSQLKRDLEFLTNAGVLDYSLLITLWEVRPEAAEVDTVSAPPGCCLARAGDACFVARLGFIDFLVHWDARKRTERALKRTFSHPRHSERITIAEPTSYHLRQLTFIEGKVFPEI